MWFGGALDFGPPPGVAIFVCSSRFNRVSKTWFRLIRKPCGLIFSNLIWNYIFLRARVKFTFFDRKVLKYSSHCNDQKLAIRKWGKYWLKKCRIILLTYRLIMTNETGHYQKYNHCKILIIPTLYRCITVWVK